MKDRLFTFIEYTKLNPTDFADKIGISRASISSIKSERTQLTLSIIIKIKEFYPELNTDWMLFGTGIMINSNSEIESSLNSLSNSEEHNNNITNEFLFDDNDDESISTDNNNRKSTGNINKEQQAVYTTRKHINYNKESNRAIEKIIIFYSDGTYEEMYR